MWNPKECETKGLVPTLPVRYGRSSTIRILSGAVSTTQNGFTMDHRAPRVAGQEVVAEAASSVAAMGSLKA
ncbi:MAG: hypothetical protein RL326_714 [Pseudomonadota bacterium]